MSGHLFPVLFLNREAKEVEGVWLLHPVACGPAVSVNVGGFTRRYNNTEGERQKKNVACTAPPARFLSWFQSSDVFKLSGQRQSESFWNWALILTLSPHPHSHTLPPFLPPSPLVISPSLICFTAKVHSSRVASSCRTAFVEIKELFRTEGFYRFPLSFSPVVPHWF